MFLGILILLAFEKNFKKLISKILFKFDSELSYASFFGECYEQSYFLFVFKELR